MSTTISITILLLGEFLLLTVILAIVLIRHNRKQSQAFADYKQQQAKSDKVASETPATVGTPTDTDVADQLSQIIEQTKYQLNQTTDEHRSLLEKRIEFLESEISALSEDNDSDEYWNNIYGRLSVVLPAPPVSPEAVEETQEQDNTIEELAELDDLEIDTPPQDEIPTLNEELIVESTASGDESLQHGTSQKDINRLRSILGKQYGAINELKVALHDKDLTIDNIEGLSSHVEELEVSHAQFNMCVDVLEKENARLTTLIQTSDEANNTSNTPNPDASNMMETEYAETQQRLQQAEATISDLENITETQYQEIERLQDEISTLKTQLEEKQQLLENHEADQSDLSKFDENDSPFDPALIKQDIDTINAELEIKEQALTELQSLTENQDCNTSPPLSETDTDTTDEVSNESAAEDISPNTDHLDETLQTQEITSEENQNADIENSAINTADDNSIESQDTPTNNTVNSEVLTDSNLEDFDYEAYLNTETNADNPQTADTLDDTQDQEQAPLDAALEEPPTNAAPEAEEMSYEAYLQNESDASNPEEQTQAIPADTLAVSPDNLIDEEVMNQSDLEDFNYEEYLKNDSNTAESEADNQTLNKTAQQ